MPRFPDNLKDDFALGLDKAQLGLTNDAIRHWQFVLQSDPENVHVIHNLGVAFAQLGNASESIKHLQRALELKPDYAEAHYNLGNVINEIATQTGTPFPAKNTNKHEAISHFRSAIQCRPDYVEAYHNLGSVLIDLGRFDEACVWLRQAVHILGNRCPDTQGSEAAAGGNPPLGTARSFPPLLPSALNQLGLAHAEGRKYRQAEFLYQRALDLKPDMTEAHSNLGNLYQEQGRLPEALASYDLALLSDPNSASTRWNRSLSLLQSGDFVQGWAEYEWRWQRKQTPARSFMEARWDGSPLAGRTLLIYMEQGLGDMVQFIRFAAHVKLRGGRILVECPGFVAPLLARCAGIEELVIEGSPLPRFDWQIPIMSLPGVLGITLESIPNQVPYVLVEPARVERWRGVVAGDGFDPTCRSSPNRSRPLNIGIVWQGNPNHRLDRYRSVPLTLFAPLARIPGIRLISLQRGPGTKQIAALADKFSVIEFAHPESMTSEDLLDTAALMKCLDLVISVDTGTAHLAGALGVPVWVPLSAVGEWRWLLHREDSPWYPSMRLFRQRKLGQWKSVFRKMARELSKWTPPTPTQNLAQRQAASPPQDLDNGTNSLRNPELPAPLADIALPIHAAHVELSAISSAIDDPGKPSQRLLDVALQAVSHARTASMTNVVQRMSRPPYYADVWPGEHYKLLAGLVTAIQPRVVVEIGTATGLSALAIRSAMPQDCSLTTFDIVPWQHFTETHLRKEDFDDGTLVQEIADLSNPQAIRRHADLLRSADFIFVDGPKDGVFERVLLQRLSELGLPGAPLVMLDDIRVWNMLAIWREIRRPKLDLTSFGHWSGTGLIDWIEA
jgi:tetratricopeptide (TPR) repeat protein/predicted O-methyltransferase YrrM